MKSFKNFFKIKEYKNNLLETTIFNEKIKEIKSKINKGKNTTITLKDINYQNSSGNTFLHYCIKRNKYDIVSELLKRTDINVNLQNNDEFIMKRINMRQKTPNEISSLKNAKIKIDEANKRINEQLPLHDITEDFNVTINT